MDGSTICRAGCSISGWLACSQWLTTLSWSTHVHVTVITMSLLSAVCVDKLVQSPMRFSSAMCLFLIHYMEQLWFPIPQYIPLLVLSVINLVPWCTYLVAEPDLNWFVVIAVYGYVISVTPPWYMVNELPCIVMSRYNGVKVSYLHNTIVHSELVCR